MDATDKTQFQNNKRMERTYAAALIAGVAGMGSSIRVGAGEELSGGQRSGGWLTADAFRRTKKDPATLKRRAKNRMGRKSRQRNRLGRVR